MSAGSLICVSFLIYVISGSANVLTLQDRETAEVFPPEPKREDRLYGVVPLLTKMENDTMALRQANATDQQTLQDAQDLNNPSSQAPIDQTSVGTSTNDQGAVGTGSQSARTPNDMSVPANDQAAGSPTGTSAPANDQAASNTSGQAPGSVSDTGSTSDHAVSGTGTQPASTPSDTSAAANDQPATGTNDQAGATPSDKSVDANDQATAGEGNNASAGNQGEHVFIADLDGLNNSGADGFAIINTHADGSLQVSIVADGLQADQSLAAHINGFADGKEAESPTIQQDANGDGVISQSEGEATLGSSLLNLASPSSTDPAHQADTATGTSTETPQPGASTTGTPTETQQTDANAAGTTTETQQSNGTAADASHANADGTFTETFSFNAEEGAALLKTLGGLDGLDKNAIVLNGDSAHAGVNSGGEGAADGGAGSSGEQPIASGELQEVTGLSAEVASNLLAHMGSDPTSDDLASTYFTVQALQAFAAARGDSGSDQTVAGAGSAGESGMANNHASGNSPVTTPAEAGTTPSAEAGTTSHANDDAEHMQVPSQEHHGDMMFA